MGLISRNSWRRELIALATAAAAAAWGAGSARAATPQEIIAGYAAAVKKTDPAFKGFSAERGKTFYLAENTTSKGEKESCSTCHTADPTKTGKTRVGKAIEPMAFSANNKRYTDKAKVEKWFKRNCKDVYERECTPLEKGDFITYMISIK